MPIVPEFRTLVNEIGVTPRNIFWPTDMHLHNILIDKKTYVYWYWMLYQLTFKYAYTINGERIERTVKTIVFDYYKRIEGLFAFAQNTYDDADGIQTDLDLLICQPYNNELAQNRQTTIHLQDAIKGRKYVTGPYAYSNPLPPSTPIWLCFKFQEYADCGDFILETLPTYTTGPGRCGSEEDNTLLHSYEASFLGYPVTFFLSTPTPQDIEGCIDNITIEAEFYTPR